MNFVAAMLLHVCGGSDARAFDLMVPLMEFELGVMFAPGLRRLGCAYALFPWLLTPLPSAYSRPLPPPCYVSRSLCFYQLERLVSRRFPRLHAHMTQEGISPAMYSSGWFLTIFSNFHVFGLGVTCRVWDEFLVVGWKVCEGAHCAGSAFG